MEPSGGQARALARRCGGGGVRLSQPGELCRVTRQADGAALFSKNTPIDIIDKLYMRLMLASPIQRQARLAEAGVTLLTGSTAGFGNLIVDETRRGQGDQVRG
jgi:hypothetical protein